MESRRKLIVFPREHGAWGILLVPLVSGAAVGLLEGGSPRPLLPLTIAALALFWLRTPVESWLGTSAMRARTSEEFRLIRRTVLTLTAIAAISLAWLFWGGANGQLFWIGGAAAVAFAAQALLKKAGRGARVVAQVVGAAGLTAAAPAGYYVATGNLNREAWALWAANLLFAANQIHFVQLRIHAAKFATRSEKLAAGRGFLTGQAALMVLMAAACAMQLYPWPAALAFLPVLYRGFAWFAAGLEPLAVRSLGWRELRHAAAFCVLLVAGIRLGS
jgi:hypothetical protein